MERLNFKTRLYFGFAIVLLLSSAIAFINFRLTRKISDNTHIIYNHPLTVSNSVRDINIYIGEMQRTMKDIALSTDAQRINELEREIDELQSNVDVAFKIVFERFLGEKRIPEETYEAFKNWESIRDRIIQLKLDGKDAEASFLSVGEESVYVNQLFEKTKIMTDFAQNKANEVFNDILSQEKSSMYIIVLSFILSLLISIYIAYYISTSVSRPINEFILNIERLYKREYLRMPGGENEQEVFEGVVKELTDAYRRLESFNSELEVQVKSRTKELQESQEKLITRNKEVSHLNVEYKRQNIDLQAAIKKAKESERLKSAFLANMSHEIRTPMNGILGFANLLQEEGLDENERKTYIDVINKSGKQLLTIISDIIDISKIEADQVTLKPASENLNSIIRDLKAQFDVELKNRNKGHVQTRISTGLPDWQCQADVDKVRLTQILMNLIGNAIKFTEKGFIEFGYRLIEEDKLLFYVKDTGVGISSEDQRLIFGRFRQADDPHVKNAGGTGLGLAISQGLISLMGGEIWVESIKGKGAVFNFTIPFVASENVATKETLELKQVPNYNWSNKYFLVVDDTSEVHQYIEALLKDTRAKLIHATTGQEAVDKALSDQKIDLVLMDIQLPDISGLEATRLIKKKRNIAIIGQSAYAMPGDKEKALAAGCSDYITKPLGKEELYTAIDRSFSLS